MIAHALTLVTLCTAVGSGLAAGVFFAFSTFVMPALARLPADQGVAAMQAINVAAINRWFMGVLFGTALACVALAVAPLLGGRVPGRWLVLGGAAVYLAGIVVVTAVFNVPRNDALAAVPAGGPAAAALWARYLAEWTAWNHVRTAAGVVATALLVAAMAARE